MTFSSVLLPTLAAVFLGGAIGLERQTRGHAAGLRTHILVSLAASMFILAGREMNSHSGGDMTRVVQRIAAGFGCFASMVNRHWRSPSSTNRREFWFAAVCR
jgi:putative Mg2+ transporter-C (MgtC) family protein